MSECFHGAFKMRHAIELREHMLMPVSPTSALDRLLSALPNSEEQLMSCSIGTALLHDYQHAVSRRKAARDRLLLAAEQRDAYDEKLFLTKLAHSRALVDWVTHRAFCIECRLDLQVNGRTLFASV